MAQGSQPGVTRGQDGIRRQVIGECQTWSEQHATLFPGFFTSSSHFLIEFIFSPSSILAWNQTLLISSHSCAFLLHSFHSIPLLGFSVLWHDGCGLPLFSFRTARRLVVWACSIHAAGMCDRVEREIKPHPSCHSMAAEYRSGKGWIVEQEAR